MPTQATTAEGSSSVGTIDGAELLRAAELMDQQNPYEVPDEDSEPIAQQKPSKDETSGDRDPDASGAEKADKDKAEPSAEKKPEQELDQHGQPRDEKGRFKPKEQEPAPETAAEESKYSKARKEEERQRNLLANFEKDKAEFRAEQERIKQELAAQRAEVEKFKKIPRAADGTPYEFNSKQYGKAADDFYGRARKALQEGDIEASNKLLEQAEQCSAAADQVAQAEYQYQVQQQQQQLGSVWQQNMSAAIANDPDLKWNDQEPTPLNQEIASILNTKGNEFLYHLPHGFAIAAQVAKWKLGDAERSALSEKLQAAEAEVARLSKLTGIRSAPSSPASIAKSDQLTESQLLEWARQADAA